MKIFILFWIKVIGRAVNRTWKFIKDHIIIGLLLLLGLIITSHLASKGIIDNAIVKGYVSDIKSWERYFAVLLFIVVPWFLINLAYQPASMFNELGGFNQLKLRIKLECKPPRYSEKWVSLTIHNDHPSQPIRSCSAYLKSTISLHDGISPLKRPDEKLAWSSHNPPLSGDKDIPPLQSIVVDVLRTIHSENRIMFTTQDANDLYKDKAYKGKYKAEVRIVGIFNNKQFEENRIIEFEYNGDMNLSCENID